MPRYKYRAVTLDGASRKGQQEATTVSQLSSALRESGLFLLDCETLEDEQAGLRLKSQELADFCRQLGAMLSSGITLIRAMQIIAQRDAKPRVKKCYARLVEDLKRGHSLYDAMRRQGKAFAPLLVNMMRAGEDSGGLDTTANKMAQTYEKQHRIDAKLRSASIYPIVLLVMIVLVVVIMFTFVLPQFMGVFKNMALPLPTQAMMAVSDFLVHNLMTVAAAAVVAAAGVVLVFKQPGPRWALDRAKVRLPVVGKLLRTVYTARFARTLASLYASGIPMMQALSIARTTMVNSYLERQFDEVLQELGNGSPLSQALKPVDGFDQKLYSTILIGEESGRLEHMLDSVADQFDYEAEVATQRLAGLMEPAMIIILAVIVAGVIISVLLPVLQMYQEAEGM
ncbi:MAG: type II secretion system F family protein [Coriobacteriales bacterium]|jgi:type IV pilus assembly protein PilC|nr:type II secretion system F family protein [Coriobacteriales bacterium]